jgi:hypothetical protein
VRASGGLAEMYASFSMILSGIDPVSGPATPPELQMADKRGEF